MPLDLQAKLLRVLETGEYLKVGDNKPTKVNVRIIAATNRNLKSEIDAGNFRRFVLSYCCFEIHLPPLRERISDIDDLAYFFLKKCTSNTNKKITTISKEYIDLLKQHHWKE
jgi:transcriptional regulator with PAS, ATPase and Fis domain